MTSSECLGLIDELKRAPDYRGQIAHHQFIAERVARYRDLHPPLAPLLEQALRGRGVERLYAHQVEAIEHARCGESVVVVTSAASGKSLTYNAPVIETMLENRGARALYLFPTKALAQDQKRKLDELGLYPRIKCATYDGDTATSERRAARQVAQIVLTNPDMLHVGILPNHTLWSRLLMNLRYVVIDELHAYRGVFGAHVAHVLRRLRRLCAHYDAAPQFLCASATIANPNVAAARLVGLPFHVVRDDAAPRAEKHVLLWNPPALELDEPPPRRLAALTPTRKSANSEAVGLFARLVGKETRTIVFTKARVTAELILRFVRGELPARLQGKVMSYRAGYLPEQRREIERQLFDGALLGVASTNALELGVDIGGLDAAILVGYPGSIASTLQQAGRAGRSGEASLVILIALNGPLDQYLARHPQFLFGRSAEEVVVDPGNLYILAAHLLCAAHEHPLASDELSLFGLDNEKLCAQLADAGLLTRRSSERRDRWFWVGQGRPHDDVSLRAAGGQPFEIRDLTQGGALLGRADAERAFTTVHEGAVYLHMGESYLVDRLDLIGRCAHVKPAGVNFYTRPMTSTETSIVEVEREAQLPNGDALRFGALRATHAVVGYKRLQQFTEQVLSTHRLDLPPSEFETRGLWFSVSPDPPVAPSPLLGSLHALEHATIAMMPVLCACDSDDIGGVSYAMHPETGQPSVFIYDGYPGGAGFAERAFHRMNELLAATLSMLRECPCQDGCPSCVQSPRCGNNNEPLDKSGAIAVLKRLLQSEI